jgi:hypothetical protein
MRVYVSRRGGDPLWGRGNGRVAGWWRLWGLWQHPPYPSEKVDPPSTHGRRQEPALLSSPLPLPQRGSPPLRDTRSLLKNALIEGCQELHVGAGFGHMLQQGFHGFQAALVGQRGEHAAHDDDGTQRLIVKEQLFAAGAGQ